MTMKENMPDESRLVCSYDQVLTPKHPGSHWLTVTEWLLLLPWIRRLVPECRLNVAILGFRATDLEVISTGGSSQIARQPNGKRHPWTGGSHPEMRCQSWTNQAWTEGYPVARPLRMDLFKQYYVSFMISFVAFELKVSVVGCCLIYSMLTIKPGGWLFPSFSAHISVSHRSDKWCILPFDSASASQQRSRSLLNKRACILPAEMCGTAFQCHRFEVAGAAWEQ